MALLSRPFYFRAEDGAQTRDPQLGRLMLYQLSYFRKNFFEILRHCQAALGIIKASFASALICTTIPQFLRRLVGKDGFEPPKAYASRFTVCPIWPLWYLPLSFLRCKDTTNFKNSKLNRPFLLLQWHILHLYCPKRPLHAPEPAPYYRWSGLRKSQGYCLWCSEQRCLE